VLGLTLISHGIPKGSVRLHWKSAIRADFERSLPDPSRDPVRHDG